MKKFWYMTALALCLCFGPGTAADAWNTFNNSTRVYEVANASAIDNEHQQQTAWSEDLTQQLHSRSLSSLLPSRLSFVVGAAPLVQGATLRWTGDPSRGLNTFEGVEDDRANSHPAGRPHIKVSGSEFRWDMHLVDRDGSDRQRHEVKGMRTSSGAQINILRGQTWRFTYEMFMPTSLTGGSRFTHIHQQKMVSDAGSSGRPLATLSTSLRGGREVLVMRSLEPGGDLGETALSPLRNKWIQVELEYKFDRADRGGRARMTIRDGDRTVVNAARSGINMWENEGTRDRRVRPKWGIYRSIESSGLQNTNLRLRNMKAFQIQ